MIRVWQYWVVRPKGLLIFSQFAVLALLLLLIVSTRQSASGAVAQLQTGTGWLLVLAATQVGIFVNRLDEAIIHANPRRFLTTTLKAIGAGVVLLALLFTLFPGLSPGYTQASAVMTLSVAGLVAVRPLARLMVRRKKMAEGLLILGTGEMARRFYLSLANQNGQIGRVVTELPRGGEEAHDPGFAIHYSELRELTERHGISRIVVADPDPSTREDLAVALLDCKMRGLAIEQAADSYERLNGKIWIEGIRPEWLIYSDGFRPSKIYLALKSVTDFCGALALLVLSAPVMALVAAGIKLTSPGPLLFRQERIGRFGESFTLRKFRSMYQDAEARTGPTWAGEDDPRITPFGRFLRKFRLDELPQAFNVLAGHMSLVGPRPERPYFVSLLRERIPYYDLRHYVKPGITGWAQVMYPYGASVEDAYEKLQYDLYYAKRVSWKLDLRVLARTLKVVLFGRGR